MAGLAGRNESLLSRLVAEVGLEFIRLAFPLVGIGRCFFLARDVGPFGGVFAVELEPFFSLLVGVGDNGLRRAFGLAHAAVDAFFRADDEHVLAFIEAIDRAHFDAIHVFAADAGFGHDVRHKGSL